MTDYSQDPVIKAYVEAKALRDRGIPVASAEVFDWLQSDEEDLTLDRPTLSPAARAELAGPRPPRWRRLWKRTR